MTNTDKRSRYDNFIHGRRHHRRIQASRWKSALAILVAKRAGSCGLRNSK